MRGFLGRTPLLEYWEVLRRRRWTIYLATGVVTVIAVVSSFFATEYYRATTTLKIERQNPAILDFRDVSSTDYSWLAYSDFYHTQHKILASDAVIRRAARRLELAQHPLFAGAGSAPGLFARLRGLLSRGDDEESKLTEEDLTTLWVGGGLEIRPVRNTQLVQVSWVSTDPELAAEVANAVADAYIQFNLESTFTTTGQATDFLIDQIASLKKEIGVLEAELQEYGEAKSIVSIDDSQNVTLRALSDIAGRRTQAQTRLAEAEARWQALREAPADALPEVLHSPLIARLKGEHATLEAEYSEQSRLFREEWPQLKSLKSKLDEVDRRLQEETTRIAEQIRAQAENDFLLARNELQKLDRLFDQHETAAQRLKRDAYEYATLLAEAARKKDTLDALMTRQNEMALSTRLKDLDATSSNIQIVDRARAPSAPFRPNRKLNLAIGLFLGLTLGIGLALVLDFLDNTISGVEQMTNILDLPALASIPRHGALASPLSRVRRRAPRPATGAVDLVAHREGMAAAAEAYRDLRTSLLLSNPGRPPAQILLTSALPEDGKSATAVNLAVVLAQLGRRILLVDADLRRPRMHKIFGIKNDRGTSNYLSGLEGDLDPLIHPTDIEGLDLLVSGPLPPNPSELLNSQRFAELGQRLVESGYDHVLYDSPPVLSVSDPIILSAVVDGTIVVARAGRTPRESLRLTVERLRQGGRSVLGWVLNDVDPTDGRYYGRYGGYHGEAPETTLGSDRKSSASSAARAVGQSDQA